ncbi:HAD family hydrolase [Sphingomonas sp. MMS12-HWE2-04]|uniref:HAD family hydrolase n=1 Tax=Sphingomonas sp. MMS12-HWE2-04 TaxID=3234199 RepID=UPI00384B6B58
MTDSILPHDLPSALDGRDQIKLLSLDCFDTLLWRDVHAPHDLFGAFDHCNVLQRRWAEQRARTGSAMRRKQLEVGIADIYRALLPNADAKTVADAVQAELDAEAAHCFAFAPAVALMREAKRRGLPIIIASDTYLDAKQLRGLIAAAAGEDVAALIDRFFCSSVYGRSKNEGLYELVLKELKVKPHQILHIGDNHGADVGGVARFGVNTLHLKQFTEATEQRLRLESSVSAILHPAAAQTATTHQPHRATLAAVEPQIADAAEGFGFATLGPVLHAFDRWIDSEAEALRAQHGGKVHYLFMMRDGYLPLRVHQANGSDDAGHAIEISRFTASAASYSDQAAVERYLEAEVGSDLEVLMKQMLLPPSEIAAIQKKVPPTSFGAFFKEIRHPQRMRQILTNSRAFGERLVAHVRRAVDPQPGDTLMLIDLGYNGSVQNDVEPLLKRALGVQVAGRYLLLREQSLPGLDKKGLIGPDHYDFSTLEALSGNVAVIEQACTAAQGSVVDYKQDGTPIRRGSSIKGRQSAMRDRIQEGCLRFARAQKDVAIRAAAAPQDAAMWRRGAASVLTRLMFLPMADELAVLSAFEHDVNLGVDYTVPLFDPATAKRGLRQRGLFYMKSASRMYLPAELHGEGLAVKLSLLAQKRFGLPLKYADFVDTTISLPVIVADGTNVSTGQITATPTHDGYFLAPIPIGDCRFSVGLQFGQLFDWVQVESATFMPVDRFLAEKERAGGEEIDANPSLEGMEQAAPHLFRCNDEYAFMMVPPPARADDRPMMLAVVFRPIATRETLANPAAAVPQNANANAA